MPNIIAGSVHFSSKTSAGNSAVWGHNTHPDRRPASWPWNAPKLGLYQVIWESKKLGNARRFTQWTKKPPKPLSNDPGFTLLRRIPSRFLFQSDAPLSFPGTLLGLLSNLSRHQKFGGAPVDFLGSFSSNNWLGAYPPPRIIILYMVEKCWKYKILWNHQPENSW